MIPASCCLLLVNAGAWLTGRRDHWPLHNPGRRRSNCSPAARQLPPGGLLGRQRAMLPAQCSPGAHVGAARRAQPCGRLRRHCLGPQPHRRYACFCGRWGRVAHLEHTHSAPGKHLAHVFGQRSPEQELYLFYRCILCAHGDKLSVAGRYVKRATGKGFDDCWPEESRSWKS